MQQKERLGEKECVLYLQRAMVMEAIYGVSQRILMVLFSVRSTAAAPTELVIRTHPLKREDSGWLRTPVVSPVAGWRPTCILNPMSAPVIRALTPGIIAPVPTFFFPVNEDLGSYHLLAILSTSVTNTFFVQISRH